MIIPLPKYYEPEVELTPNQASYKQVTDYLNVPNWKCQVCGSVMFGRVKSCVYCRYKKVNTDSGSAPE